ncbi:MAG TPA: DNA polymerase III subunit delta [Solirubrobacteraceae bacterium]|nr:DNA polymerase III subunit delta [Solirubrobacteraceae bacterium]
MAELKPAYLIHGDDHGAIAQRRARLRALAESRGEGSTSLELIEGEAATPAGVAAALATMTLALGAGEDEQGLGRVILVDGAERFKQDEVERELAPALAAIAPRTTIALFAREEGRTTAPAALHEAVRAAGGQIVAQATVKPWQLPRWVRDQAQGMGLALDEAAAKALVRQVGERQQRLLRELEKLALELGPTAVRVEQVEARSARSRERRAYTLADALVAGDGRAATQLYLSLREQGERLAGLTYLLAQRLRDALAVSVRLRRGEPPGEVRRTLRMPQRAAERFIADVSDADPERLRRALRVLAELELNSRGGAPPGCGRSAAAALSEDTLTLRAIEVMTVGEGDSAVLK